MSLHFSRSLRKLESDTTRRNHLLLSVVLVVLTGWVAWFAEARVAVFATANTARLEVDRENHPVDAPVSGRVIVAPLTAGRTVKAGEIIVKLDASAERLARSEAESKSAPTERQLASLAAELQAQRQALEQETASAQSAIEESASKAQEASSASELATDEAERIAGLQRVGLISELESLRLRKLAEEKRAQAQAAQFALLRVKRDLDARTQDRLGKIARLENEVAGLQGSHQEGVAAANRLSYEIEQREIRASVDGMLAEISPLKVGSMVRAGDRICTIVPSGSLKVIAQYVPSVALGRVKPGQHGIIRLEAFPWMQFGSANATVTRVDTEVRDSQIRVELALEASPANGLPLQHGLPAEVDIEIEHLSPMAMMLRSAGAHLRVSAATER